MHSSLKTKSYSYFPHYFLYSFASILSITKIPELRKLFLYKPGYLEWKTLLHYCKSEEMASMISRFEGHPLIKVADVQYTKELSTNVINELIENVHIVCRNQFSYHSFDPKTIKYEESREKIILRHGIFILEKNLPNVAPSVNRIVENSFKQIVSDEQFSQVFRAYKRVMEIFASIFYAFRRCKKDKQLIREYAPFFQKIYKIYSNQLPGDGFPRKGAYPVTVDNELILLRNKRDEWMAQAPKVAKPVIRNGLHVTTG